MMKHAPLRCSLSSTCSAGRLLFSACVVGQHDDDGAVGLAQFLRRIEDRLHDAATFWRLGPDPELQNIIAQPLNVRV